MTMVEIIEVVVPAPIAIVEVVEPGQQGPLGPAGEPGAGPPQAGSETEAEAVPQLSNAKADDQQVPMARID